MRSARYAHLIFPPRIHLRDPAARLVERRHNDLYIFCSQVDNKELESLRSLFLNNDASAEDMFFLVSALKDGGLEGKFTFQTSFC